MTSFALFSLKPMLFGVFMGTIVVASSYSWPVAWIGLELNLMAFIPSAMPNIYSKKGAMMYFVSQSCGSLLMLVGGLLWDYSWIPAAVVLGGILIKMGLMPMHFWLPSVVVTLSRFYLFLLLSWQKLGPLVMIMSTSVSLVMVGAVNAVGGALVMGGVTLLPLFLFYSGMVQMGWVLYTSGSFTFYYLFVYFIVLGSVVLYSNNASIQFGWALLNAGGLPPFSGFVIKMKAILNIQTFYIILLVGSSGVALASYIRVLLNTSLKTGVPPSFLYFTLFVGMV